MTPYTFAPSIRSVTSAGAQILRLDLRPDLVQQDGINLASTSVTYTPEMLGPWMNYSYSQRWKFLGYRVNVSLRFDLIVPQNNSTKALRAMLAILRAGWESQTFAGCQFNLFADFTASGGGTVYAADATNRPWRGMLVKSAWSPRPAGGKQTVGYEMTVDLESRDLIAAPGDWELAYW